MIIYGIVCEGGQTLNVGVIIQKIRGVITLNNNDDERLAVVREVRVLGSIITTVQQCESTRRERKIIQNLIKLLNYMIPSEENLGRQGEMSSLWKVTKQADKNLCSIAEVIWPQILPITMKTECRLSL